MYGTARGGGARRTAGAERIKSDKRQGKVLCLLFLEALSAPAGCTKKETEDRPQCHLDAHTAKLLYHEDLDRFNANTNISSRVYGQKFYFWKRQTDSHVWAVY